MGHSPSGGGIPSELLDSGSSRGRSPRKLDKSPNRQATQAAQQSKNQKWALPTGPPVGEWTNTWSICAMQHQITVKACNMFITTTKMILEDASPSGACHKARSPPGWTSFQGRVVNQIARQSTVGYCQGRGWKDRHDDPRHESAGLGWRSSVTRLQAHKMY